MIFTLTHDTGTAKPPLNTHIQAMFCNAMLRAMPLASAALAPPETHGTAVDCTELGLGAKERGLFVDVDSRTATSCATSQREATAAAG